MSHPISALYYGEICGMCLRSLGVREQATHKVGEEILSDDPYPARHNLTQYVCCHCFGSIFGRGNNQSCWHANLCLKCKGKGVIIDDEGGITRDCSECEGSGKEEG